MYLMSNLVLAFLRSDRLFFLFWYVALDLAFIKAVLLFFCLTWSSDFQHIFKGCIVPLKKEIFL